MLVLFLLLLASFGERGMNSVVSLPVYAKDQDQENAED